MENLLVKDLIDVLSTLDESAEIVIDLSSPGDNNVTRIESFCEVEKNNEQTLILITKENLRDTIKNFKIIDFKDVITLSIENLKKRKSEELQKSKDEFEKQMNKISVSSGEDEEEEDYEPDSDDEEEQDDEEVDEDQDFLLNDGKV